VGLQIEREERNPFLQKRPDQEGKDGLERKRGGHVCEDDDLIDLVDFHEQEDWLLRNKLGESDL